QARPGSPKEVLVGPPDRTCIEELLSRGEVMRSLEDILLINSKCSSKKATTLQTVKVPRSDGK
uniref:Uncharacterized protein n=1 Tax=Cyanistes caeruleus TaxID=156563 RepID=A0A8C0UDK0_CYACU